MLYCQALACGTAGGPGMSAQREHAILFSRLHDDTEEDLVGADWHQEAIRAAVYSLRDLAVDRQSPWHVGDQLTLVGAKPDGTAWRPSPDIMVHPRGGTDPRNEMVVRSDGPPALVIEVASPSTWAYDVDAHEGKAFGYAYLGVLDDLIFDPHADLWGTSCRGWQLRDGVAHEWRPGADGRYHTSMLGISLQSDGSLLRVFDPEGRPVPFYSENTQRLRAQVHDIQTLEQRVAALEAALARLQRDAPDGS